MNKRLFLRFPNLNDKNNYTIYQKEEHDIDINYDEWLKQKELSTNQIGIIDGKVPRTILLLVDEDNNIYGQVSIRYSIDTPNLSKYIGHIGYEIKTEYRGHGLGNLILQLALNECKKHGLSKVMVSCNKNNLLSTKVIEKNNGKFEREEYVKKENQYYKIYWINL